MTTTDSDRGAASHPSKEMARPTAFLCAPFERDLDAATGVLRPEKKDFLVRLIGTLERTGFVVGNAHEREDWGAAWMPAARCTRLDINAIRAADLVVALPGSPASGGVHIELGWASASSVPIVMLLESGSNYSSLVHGLDVVGPVVKLEYTSPAEAEAKLRTVLMAYKSGTDVFT